MDIVGRQVSISLRAQVETWYFLRPFSFPQRIWTEINDKTTSQTQKANHGARAANSKARKPSVRRFGPSLLFQALRIEVSYVCKGLYRRPRDIGFFQCYGGHHEIRRWNPQRHEMEQLTAIILEDPVKNICGWLQDLTHDEFWVRGTCLASP